MNLKIKKLFAISLFALAAIFSVSAKEKKQKKIVTYQTEFKQNSVNKKLCYQLMENGNIVFVFDAAKADIAKPKQVFVEGSFNGWAKNNSDWELKKFKYTTWTLECPLENVLIPGNSGFPEFKFYVIAEVEYEVQIVEATSIRTRIEKLEPTLPHYPGFQMSNNNLILLPNDNPETVIANTKIANKVKKLKEFNLENPEDIATISNFRLVPGTTKLFRGYHPYKISREYDTEKERIRLVNKQIKDNQIKSIITLSGKESLDPKKEQISVYVNDIQQAGNQLFIKTHYNTVYYASNTREFGNMIGEIVKFIGSHPGPYYVHCRLGTDRTGVISANLAALCGATWDEIAEDYQKTNEIGIKEFRDYKLLQYSFEHMLGKKMNEISDLQKEVSNYYLQEKFITQSELNALLANLK